MAIMNSKGDRAYYYNYHYFTFASFFYTSVFQCLSLDAEWLQVSSSLKDSSEYSGPSQQRWTLNYLNSSDLQFLQSLFYIFGDRSKPTNHK